VDVESFKPGTARATRSNNLLRLVYVGRLSPEKGVHILIEAFNQVLERTPQARLDLIGGASMFSYAAVKLFRRDPHWAAIFSFYGSNPLQRLFRQLYQPGKRLCRCPHVDAERAGCAGNAVSVAINLIRPSLQPLPARTSS